jgi:hypothetical protein
VAVKLDGKWGRGNIFHRLGKIALFLSSFQFLQSQQLFLCFQCRRNRATVSHWIGHTYKQTHKYYTIRPTMVRKATLHNLHTIVPYVSSSNSTNALTLSAPSLNWDHIRYSSTVSLLPFKILKLSSHFELPVVDRGISVVYHGQDSS